MKYLTALIGPSTELYKVTLRRALKICQYFEANLHIVSILPESDSDVDLDWTTEVLREAANKLIGKEHHLITFTYEVAVGRIIPIIKEITKSNNSDLLIMGTNSNRFLHTWLHGTEENVGLVHEVDCPVLLVPPSDFQKRIKRIVYATEFAFDDIAALNIIEDWANVFKSEIICLHVCKSELDVAAAEKKLISIGKRFSKIDFQYKIMIGNIVDNIRQEMLFEETDLVVCLHKRRSWWSNILKPSVTLKIAEHATVPMLLFKQI